MKARRGNEIRLSQTQQAWVYSTFAILFLSGVLWIVFHFFVSTAGTFGPAEPSAVEPASLQIHGAAAMAFLIVLGSLIPGHIRGGWLARKNFKNGIFFLLLNAVLIVSGYGLYYASGENVRLFIEWVHLIIGVGVAPALAWHVIAGRKLAKPRTERTTREFE